MNYIKYQQLLCNMFGQHLSYKMSFHNTEIKVEQVALIPFISHVKVYKMYRHCYSVSLQPNYHYKYQVINCTHTHTYLIHLDFNTHFMIWWRLLGLNKTLHELLNTFKHHWELWKKFEPIEYVRHYYYYISEVSI
jgi:hypothetical protein